MTHRADPPPPLPAGRPSAPARPHRRRNLVVALVTTLAIGAVTVIAAVAYGVSRTDLVGTTTVTASSSAVGTSPGDVVPHPGARSGGWRSNGETVGAWVELAWPTNQPVRRVSITRGALDKPGATDGFLSFGDGSFEQVRLSTASPTTVVPLAARLVNRVRFTVSAVSPGARGVSFTAITVGTNGSSRDVVSDDRPDRNAAATADITQDVVAHGSDPRALLDGSGAPGPVGTGADWIAATPAGASVELRWGRPRELSSIQIVGSNRAAARLSSATVTFSDGAVLPVGAVLADPSRPTLVAFMPRAVTSLRITFDRLDGPGALALAELRTYESGATPPRTSSGGPAPVSTPSSGVTCAAPTSAIPDGLSVVCPPSDSTVGAVTTIRASASGFAGVTATVWPADDTEPAPSVRVPVDAAGQASLTLDTSAVAPGPFVVSVEADAPARQTAQVLVQLDKSGRIDSSPPSAPPSVGRTMVYDEEFDHPVSLSRSGQGADYAAAKPTDSGVQDFGDAIFPDPARGLGNVGTVDGMLRLGAEPLPRGYADPVGAGRTHIGGMLASARPGGSGFSAQYGYFEARMFAPAAPGTWPAFWLLPSDNLVAPTSSVAEIDAVELYGHDPTGSCQSTHDYRRGRDDGVASCADDRFTTVRDAMAWHTYGVAVSPTGNTFYIDGRIVATSPQVSGGGAPLFFLADLALGGGWPVQLGGVADRAALYVDYVRVFV